MSARVLVTGGRKYDDREFIYGKLDELHNQVGIALVIHGAATGADSLARGWAVSRGVQHDPHPADWKNVSVEGALVKYNKFGAYNAAAGHQRNDRMLRLACPTHAMVFLGGAGTEDMYRRIVRARKLGQQVELLDYRVEGWRLRNGEWGGLTEGRRA